MSLKDPEPEEKEDGESEEDVEDAVFRAERGPNREGMTSDYMPHENQWEAKTVLDVGDPAALAAVAQYGKITGDDELQAIIDNAISIFLPAKTSVRGQSRDEYRDMIMSMFGGKVDSDSPAAWARAFGAMDEDD